MNGSLFPILTLNSGTCQRTKHRHRKAPTMTLSKSSGPADYLLMNNLIWIICSGSLALRAVINLNVCPLMGPSTLVSVWCPSTSIPPGSRLLQKMSWLLCREGESPGCWARGVSMLLIFLCHSTFETPVNRDCFKNAFKSEKALCFSHVLNLFDLRGS